MIRYEKTKWENDKTPINAQHLSKVEDGLEYLFDVIKDVPAGEDARVANEKQRQSNETTRQNNELKRNDTLKNEVEKVNNAITASNNNIKEVINKFESIVASKQQDGEVILARGKYPSLPTRLDNLDKDLLNVKDTAIIPITTENNFLTVEETVSGYLKNFKLEGRTLIINSQNEEVGAGVEGAILKSVGEGVDEIVVSTVNKNLLDEDAMILGWINKNDGRFNFDTASKCSNYIYLHKGTYYLDATVSGTNPGYAIYSLGKEYIKGGKNGLITVDFDCFIRCTIDINTRACLFVGNNKSKYVPHKSDKKKILYYDTETQSWKKPTLRELDSIEEHSDNKYYYHKRSLQKTLKGEVVENWLITSNNEEYISFKINIVGAKPTGGTSPYPVTAKSDKFVWQDRAWDVNNISNGEGFAFSNTDSYLYVKIYKSKLETQNVEGFKKWLQVNPVTVVYQLAQEEVCECTPIDLIAFENETNYMINSGPIIPKSTFKCESSIGNVINTLKEKVGNLEDKLYKTNLANFTVALNALDTKLKLEQLTKTPK